MTQFGRLRAPRDVKACNQCGKCCQHYADGGLSATPGEIQWWQTSRPDIARFVRNGQIWRDPDTGAQLDTCPWLTREAETNRYACSIYADRPEDCRQYPVLLGDMIRDGCEMLEVKDLHNPARTQRTLDRQRTGLA